METIIKTNKLCKTFSTGGIQQHVLKNVDLEIYKGDFTVIMGASGAGKSTLLYALSGMDKPTLGEITFSGKEITKMNVDQLAEFRRDHCGFVFQQIYLVDSMSVLDNCMAAGLLVNKNKKEVAEKAKEVLEKEGYLVRLSDVIGVEMADEVGALNKLLIALKESNINLNYIYLSFNRDSACPVQILHTDDTAEVASCLESKGFRLL